MKLNTARGFGWVGMLNGMNIVTYMCVLNRLAHVQPVAIFYLMGGIWVGSSAELESSKPQKPPALLGELSF